MPPLDRSRPLERHYDRSTVGVSVAHVGATGGLEPKAPAFAQTPRARRLTEVWVAELHRRCAERKTSR